jgi:DNA-binding GntR family transcriptional regulator
MSTQAPTSLPRLAAPLRKQVADELRQGILSNRFPPGSRLIERILCDELQVSRTVVREALRQLESEHLIELVANVGPIVRSLSDSEVRSLYEVRAALESLAGGDCATNASAAVQERLKTALRLVQSTDPTDIAGLLAAKDEFTAALIEGSGNEVIGDMLSSIHARVSRLRALTLQAPGRIATTIRELEEICDAVLKRDSAKAAAACREHVESAARIALSAQTA